MPDKPFQNYPDLTALSSAGIRLLIFDLDGTLLDSMGVWNDVDIEFLGRYGYFRVPIARLAAAQAAINE